MAEMFFLKSARFQWHTPVMHTSSFNDMVVSETMLKMQKLTPKLYPLQLNNISLIAYGGCWLQGLIIMCAS